MFFFVFCIGLLYIATFFSKKSVGVFNKEQVGTLKGIMSIAIVAFHLSCYTKGYLSLFSNWGAPIVSIFYFISGYGLMYNKECKGNEYLLNFLQKRICCSLLLPFFIVWFINKLATNYHTDNLYIEAINLIKSGKTSLAFSWYVFSILFFYLMFFFTAKNKNLIITSFVYTIAYITFTYYMGYERCWYISALAFPMGIFYCKTESRLLSLWKDPFKYYTTVPICLLLLAIIVISKLEIMFFIAYICIPIIIACILAKVNLYNKFLTTIGLYSYEIYLCHGLCMMFLRGNNVYVKSDIQYIIATYIFTFLMAYFVKNICKQLTIYILKHK